MKNILWLLVITVVVILSAIFFYSKLNNQTSPKLNIPSSSQSKELKASFLIVTNNTIRVFTDSKYHNQSESVYLKKDNPKIIYVNQDGVTWGDFFETLPMEVTKDCLITGTGQRFCNGGGGELTFYLNGLKEDDFLDLEIKSNDKGLILFGEYTTSQAQKYFNQL